MLVAEDLGNSGGLVPTGVKTKNLKQKVVGRPVLWDKTDGRWGWVRILDLEFGNLSIC